MRAFVRLVLLAALVPTAAAQSLYSEAVARQVGDLLTVLLAERTTAQRQSDYADQGTAGFAGSATTSGDLAGRFGLDARFSSDASATNRTAQSDLLSGTLTVLVTDVDPAGNLYVEGERRLNVNGVGHRLYVAGLVRPRDIRAGNVILSHQIANAEVVYRQDGLRNRFFRPATLLKLGAAALVVAAVIVGGSRLSADTPAE